MNADRNLRVDSHQRFTAAHPPEHFGPILSRNKFVGSVCVLADDDPEDWADFEFVLAIVGRGSRWRGHPKFRGLISDRVAEPPAPGETLDLIVRTADLPSVLRLAERAPDSRIALDHLGGPDLSGADFAEWAEGMRRLAEFPNVYCKLSGMVRAADVRPHVQHLLRCFGPQQLMFGSGWPDCLPEHAWKETLAAFTQALGAAPIEVREELLGGTAARFYGIAQPAVL